MREEKGITLIALVITIIVMLILATVSVTLILDGDLFTNAKRGVAETNNAVQEENDMAQGRFQVNGTVQNISEIVNGTI